MSGAAFILVGILIICLLIGKGQRAAFVLSEEQLMQVLDTNSKLSGELSGELSSELSGELSPDKQKLVDSCVSLVGKVGYFWGGKSSADGWDERWGVPTVVESSGSETTGTVRPFGLDCSGYVTWAFLQLDRDDVNMTEAIGHGTWKQWENSSEITWEELSVGDLAFQNEYPGSSGNHVGICIGFLDGEPVFAHCSFTENCVVVTNAGDIFRYPRRPSVFE